MKATVFHPKTIANYNVICSTLYKTISGIFTSVIDVVFQLEQLLDVFQRAGEYAPQKGRLESHKL